MDERALVDRHLRLLGVAAFCAMAAMRCADPMLGSLAQAFQRNLRDVSLVVSAFAVSYGVLQLLYGPLGDRVGKLRVVALASAGCAGASALAALAGSLDALVAARALMGAAAAGVVPLAMAWVGDSVPYARRQETLARLMGATVSGMIAGQWLGAWLTAAFGWRMVFVVLAVAFVGASLPLWRAACAAGRAALPRPAGAAPCGWGGQGLLRVPRVRWVLSIAAVEGALMFGVLALAPTFLARRHGLDTGAAGVVIALFGVGGWWYSRCAGRLLARFGERGLSAGGGALLGGALPVLAWSAHGVAAALACLVAGAGFYMLHGTLQTQATQMAPERRGSAVAAFACCLFIGQSVGIVAVSSAMDAGFGVQAITLCGLCLAGLGAFVARGVAARASPVGRAS